MTGISESNSATAVSESLQIGSGKQLFVGPWADDGRDDYLVESMRNVTMTANEAWVSGDRIIETDKPWELDPPGAGMNVIKEGDTFRMYYQVDVPGEPQRGVICYAESTDGVHWIKPDLGLATWNGSRANNIILPVADSPAELANVGLVTFSGCPFVDPNAPAEQRYKAVIKTKGQVAAPSLGKGRYLVGSSDGIHWNLLSSKSVHRGDGDFSPLWDDRIGRYVAYERIKYLQVPAQIEHYTEKYGIEPEQIHWGARVLNEGRRISDDLFTWSDQVSVFAPDEIDDAFAPEGVTRIDAYGLNATRYDEAPAIYLGLPPMHSHWKCREIRGDRVLHLPSLIDVQLVTSRDGIHWHRAPGRKPFIRLGPQDSFWAGMVYPAGGRAIRVGDELWFYFTGFPFNHQTQGTEGGRGRAILRLDGFISADAEYTGGELLTRPLVFAGNRLQLNAATGAGGFVHVEIQDEAGKPIDGFAATDEHDEITGNYIRAAATWKGSTDVGALAGRPIRLRFIMRDCKLYSFQFLP